MVKPAEVSWHGTLWGVDLAGFREVESVPALDAVNRHEEDPCSHNLGRADNLPDDIRQATRLVLQVLYRPSEDPTRTAALVIMDGNPLVMWKPCPGDSNLPESPDDRPNIFQMKQRESFRELQTRPNALFVGV